jgi:hypothetical protein
MFGDYCDLYFHIDQFINESDVFDEINKIKADVDISKLPSILFWGSEISNNHLISLKDLSERDITNLLQTVFQHIRMNPVMDSIPTGEESFKRESERERAGNFCPIPIYVGKYIGNFSESIFLDWLSKKHPEVDLNSVSFNRKKYFDEFNKDRRESNLPEAKDDFFLIKDVDAINRLHELLDNNEEYEKNLKKKMASFKLRDKFLNELRAKESWRSIKQV